MLHSTPKPENPAVVPYWRRLEREKQETRRLYFRLGWISPREYAILELRYNENRDPENGRYTFGPGGAGGSSPKTTFIKSKKQFGKKIGKHATDFGLNPQNEADRQKMSAIIDDIVEHHTEKRRGSWRGQPEDVDFYIRGEDVVVAKKSGEFITVLKGGITNARVKNAGK